MDIEKNSGMINIPPNLLKEIMINKRILGIVSITFYFQNNISN